MGWGRRGGGGSVNITSSSGGGRNGGRGEGGSERFVFTSWLRFSFLTCEPVVQKPLPRA